MNQPILVNSKLLFGRVEKQKRSRAVLEETLLPPLLYVLVRGV